METRDTLYSLEVSDIQLTKHRGHDVLKKTNRIATPTGSKTAQGGLRSVNDKPMTVTIWRKVQLDGRLCVFDDIMDYIAMTQDLHKAESLFFWPSTILVNVAQVVRPMKLRNATEMFLRIAIWVKVPCLDTLEKLLIV